MTLLDRVRKLENIHIVLWLLKDTCWIQNWKVAGCVMIIPTVGMAFYITMLSRNNRKEWFHNLAVCSWILANSIWMIGEFFLQDSTRPLAMVFFVIGLASIAFYYMRPSKVERT